jgi:hypothetical protein
MSDQTKIKRKLGDDLTAEVREKAERIGSIEFKSAGAIRSANAWCATVPHAGALSGVMPKRAAAVFAPLPRP